MSSSVSYQIPQSESLADVEVHLVHEPTVRITKSSFDLETGHIYSGMTATLIADVAPYRLDGIYSLTDGSLLYETSDPRVKGSKWFFLLKEEGFYYLGGTSDILVAVDPDCPSFLPLPLYVGRNLERTTRYFAVHRRSNKDRKPVGKVFTARLTRLQGRILGQYYVKVENEEHNCLLLRDVITSQATKWYSNNEEKYDYSVLLDRYIKEDGLLHLEHIWYCQDGGKRSTSEAEARKEAKALFKKTKYAGREWYRIHGHVMKEGRWTRYP